MDFFELIKRRKSIRSFSEKPVRPDDIEKIVEAGTWAPSNCNQQLWNFIVITDSAVKERLITEASSNTLFRKAPVLIVVTYDGWNYKEAIQGASLALGHMLLAATELGIGSLPMNSYGADSQVKRILSIPEGERICCFVALGYPDNRADATGVVPRRPVIETLHWNGYKRTREIPPFTYDPNDWTIEQIADHQRYYSRKTFMGKEMDIYSELEAEVAEEAVANVQAPLYDFLTYDGAYIRILPKIPSTYVDLIPETSAYSKAAASLALGQTDHLSFKTFKDIARESANSISFLYKLERIPDSYREELFRQGFTMLSNGGTMTIVARKSNLLLSLFFLIIRFVFGDELRKTGIYNFFGPYKPISLRKTIVQLRKIGFTQVDYHGYFLIPTFYEQVYQMFLQYIKSEGSSYLHRERRVNIITRLLSFIMRIQGKKRMGRFGSVVVIQCQK